PPAPARDTLLAALGHHSAPRVTASDPVLVELWHRAGVSQLHLVNYAPGPRHVRIDFSTPVAGTILSPDDEARIPFDGLQPSLDLDVYAILEYES
ncbi:MAG TPA: hypothetical protein VLC95_12695, partial [Anaerolineae bacterium]|nr:hypothetical protein [Anaerolineae bacterium]